jgi:hypothetical protein
VQNSSNSRENSNGVDKGLRYALRCSSHRERLPSDSMILCIQIGLRRARIVAGSPMKSREFSHSMPEVGIFMFCNVHTAPCQRYNRGHSFGRFPEQRQRCLVWIPTVSRLLQQGRHGRANAAATGLKRAAPSRHLRSTCECYNVVDPSGGRHVLQRHAVASVSAKGCYLFYVATRTAW